MSDITTSARLRAKLQQMRPYERLNIPSDHLALTTVKRAVSTLNIAGTHGRFIVNTCDGFAMVSHTANKGPTGKARGSRKGLVPKGFKIR